MIRPATNPDVPMTLSQAAKVLPGRPCVQTILRWITHGVKGAGSGRVNLAGRKSGGRWYVTAAAIEQFQKDSTAPRIAADPAEKIHTAGLPARIRRRNHRRAVVNLQRQGLMD